MHSPAEIGNEDRIAQGIRLEPAVSLVSLDLDRQAIEGRGAYFHGQSLVRFTTNTHKIQFRHAPLHLTPSTAGAVIVCVTMSK